MMGLFGDSASVESVASGNGLDSARAAAAGTGSDDPKIGTGRPGRHKAGCACVVCAARRSRGGPSVGAENKRNADAEFRAETLRRVSDPANWRMVAALIPNLQHAATGWRGFLLTDEETDLLAGFYGGAAVELGLMDVKYLNCYMLAVALATIHGQRAVAYYRQRKGTEVDATEQPEPKETPIPY